LCAAERVIELRRTELEGVDDSSGSWSSKLVNVNTLNEGVQLRGEVVRGRSYDIVCGVEIREINANTRILLFRSVGVEYAGRVEGHGLVVVDEIGGKLRLPMLRQCAMRIQMTRNHSRDMNGRSALGARHPALAKALHALDLAGFCAR